MNSTAPPSATPAGCYSAVATTPLQPAPTPTTVPMMPLQPAPVPAVSMMPMQQAPMPTAPLMHLQSAPMPAVATMPPQSAPMQTVNLMPLQPAAMPMPMMPLGVPVQEVWADNFHDVHYPGVVHGGGDHHHHDLAALTAEQRYAAVKANVDALKPLQLGLAIITDAGKVAAWEFNLAGFDPAIDAHAASSVTYLIGRGLRCDDLRLLGVPVAKLTRVLRLISRPGVSWVTHTGAYHVAYLMKILNGGNQLPGDVAGFMAAVRRSLGDDVYDVATMASDCRDMPAGLEGVASRLGVAPPLSTHPLAGAGSVLALGAFVAFVKLRLHGFRGNVTRYRGVPQGLQAA